MPRILVTGASGNLGGKAVAALRSSGADQLVLLDRDPAARHGVHAVDLSRADPAWTAHFEGIDVVLHLAADSRPFAGWDAVVADNVDASLNVLQAAVEARVGRFVFASSNWVLGGYRFTAEPLRPSTPPRPVNPYGAAKLFVERAGAELAAGSEMDVVALRIGYCQRGANVPGPQMGFGRWGQEMWLSNDDWAQVAVLACTVPSVPSGVVNVMSRNAGMRWDLTATEELLGYVPTGHHTPVLTASGRLAERAARCRDRWIPRESGSPVFGARW